MAIIKFDSEKADALIKDLQKISSDIDSNMGKVYTNSYGKEINLNDSRLKVYANKNVTVDVVQPDGTIVQEIKSERYLKHNYVANARKYNQYVRNIYKKSNSAKTKATQSIESVINSLNKIKSLISEFETEQSLRMSSSLDDVGQFNFNFLSAYGPMGKPQNYSPSMGAVVVDEAFTSLHLGVLGERPTSINLEKLPVFDGMLEIARDNGLTYQEKFDEVKGLLMENVLEVNPEVMEEKAKEALECMIGIANSPDIKIDDTLRIETLVQMDIPIIENLKSSELTVDFKPADMIGAGLGASGALMGILPGQAQDLLNNLDANKDGKVDKDEAKDMIANLPKVNNSLANQLGIDTDVELDKDAGKGHGHGPNGGGNRDFAPTHRGQDNGNSGGHHGGNNNSSPANSNVPSRDNVKNAIQNIVKDNNNGRGNGKHDGGAPDVPKTEKVEKVYNEIYKEAPKFNSAPAKDDIVDKTQIEKPVLQEEVKLSSEDMAIDQELQSNKITLNYNDTNVTESSNSTGGNLELDADTNQKGAGLVAGAAGLGALTNGVGNNGSAMPQVNGMAAGEILGVDNGSSSANMGMLLGDTTNSSASTGTVVNNGATTATVGGESTSDRGSLSGNSSSQRPTNTSAAGRGGSTLEDKDSKKDENSYGKPNKPSENQDNDKKGMLGDASIAELEAKDEKQIKVATGITAGTVLTSGVLALVNVLPWLMLILALIAIGTYVGYRIKKKKDKEKRKSALAASHVQEESIVKVEQPSIEVQNVVIENAAVETASEPSQEAPVVSDVPVVDGEFSSQPYEPLRDGVIEIAGSTGSENKE